MSGESHNWGCWAMWALRVSPGQSSGSVFHFSKASVFYSCGPHMLYYWWQSSQKDDHGECVVSSTAGFEVQVCLAEEVGLPFPLCWYITHPEVLGTGPGMTPISLNVLCNLFHVNFLFTQQEGLRSLFHSVQLLSRVRLCDPMDCSMPGLLSFTLSWGLLKLMSI